MNELKTIDLTPTWGALLPALVAVSSDGTEEGRRSAHLELRRMAYAADRWNEIVPQLVAALNLVLNNLNNELDAETAQTVEAAIRAAKGEQS